MSANVRLLGLAIGLTSFAVTGCGDTHVSLERERIALGKEFLNSMASAKDINELLDKAPAIDSVATKMEQLAQRRSKLSPIGAAEEREIAKLREAEVADWKARGEEMKNKTQSSMNPMTMMSGGMPDMAKVQKLGAAFARLQKANASYDPKFAGAGTVVPFAGAGAMNPPTEGGLLRVQPQAESAPTP